MGVLGPVAVVINSLAAHEPQLGIKTVLDTRDVQGVRPGGGAGIGLQAKRTGRIRPIVSRIQEVAPQAARLARAEEAAGAHPEIRPGGHGVAIAIGSSVGEQIAGRILSTQVTGEAHDPQVLLGHVLPVQDRRILQCLQDAHIPIPCTPRQLEARQEGHGRTRIGIASDIARVEGHQPSAAAATSATIARG